MFFACFALLFPILGKVPNFPLGKHSPPITSAPCSSDHGVGTRFNPSHSYALAPRGLGLIITCCIGLSRSLCSAREGCLLWLSCSLTSSSFHQWEAHVDERRRGKADSPSCCGVSCGGPSLQVEALVYCYCWGSSSLGSPRPQASSSPFSCHLSQEWQVVWLVSIPSAT